MIRVSPTQHIKQSQRESRLLREISQILREAALDNPVLAQAFVSRVSLSSDAGICSIFFYSPGGQKEFDVILESLKLYRPSMRKTLAQRLKLRHTPELIFKFDDKFEKQQKLEQLFDKIKAH